MIKPPDPTLLVDIIAERDDVTADGIGLFMIDKGLQPGEDLITLFPLTVRKHFSVHFRSADSRDRFLSLIKEGVFKDFIRLNQRLQSILVTRVRGDISDSELEGFLFPPSLGEVPIVSRHIERKKTKQGVPLWYTGRRFYKVPLEWFVKHKHVLPTHILDGDRKIFVSFEGARQRCFKCGSEDHLIRDCKVVGEVDPSISTISGARSLFSPDSTPVKTSSQTSKPTRTASTPSTEPPRKLPRITLKVTPEDPESGRDEEDEEDFKMNFPDHPVQIDPDNEDTVYQPDQLRSLVIMLRMSDTEGLFEMWPGLLRLTDEEGALPYDHSAIFPPKPPSDSESSDSDEEEDKHQLT